MEYLIWLGIVFCISQSAMFSGLNLAFFSISKLRLEIDAAHGDKRALEVLDLRKDSNLLLATILWGNVKVNVLLTLFSNSVMTGVSAFLFSTFLITFLGEILPQAYFSRHALKMASWFAPVLRFYQFLLFPVAKLTSFVLDHWLGKEAVQYFHEKDVQELLRMHITSPETDIDRVEGRGALNFLAIDDIPLLEEGELIDPESIVRLTFVNNRPVFPPMGHTGVDAFLKTIQASEKKWVIITDPAGDLKMVLNADGFLRDALFKREAFNPYLHCHRPIIVRDRKTSIGEVLQQLKVHPTRSDDDVIDEDIIIFWGEEKKVITGADILGRLLRGIVQQQDVVFRKVVQREQRP
jgi:metal transporter CNNM